jgi:alkyl hydroperoxide reductase subunit AhpF
MSPSDHERLARRFADEMAGSVDVGLRVHAGACEVCAEAEAILRETTSLANGLALRVDTGGALVPEIRLEGAARGEVRFFGLPSGYEFPALIDSIVAVSTGRTKLATETLARVATIQRRVHLQVFTTPT